MQKDFLKKQQIIHSLLAELYLGIHRAVSHGGQLHSFQNDGILSCEQQFNARNSNCPRDEQHSIGTLVF